jgi:hypothetical protein
MRKRMRNEEKEARVPSGGGHLSSNWTIWNDFLLTFPLDIVINSKSAI